MDGNLLLLYTSLILASVVEKKVHCTIFQLNHHPCCCRTNSFWAEEYNRFTLTRCLSLDSQIMIIYPLNSNVILSAGKFASRDTLIGGSLWSPPKVRSERTEKIGQDRFWFDVEWGIKKFVWSKLIPYADSFVRFTLANFSVPTKSASIRPDKIRMCKRLLCR